MKNKNQNNIKKAKLKLLIILAIAVFIFLSGCTDEPIKPNANLGCCDPDIAASPTDPRCQLKNPGPGVELENSISCNQDSNTCDVTITIYDGPPKQETMPICTAMEALSCIQNACNAQVCGPFTYSPETIISHRDNIQLQEDLEEGEKEDVEIRGEEIDDVQNTYGTTCMVLPTDENLTNVFTNTRGSFINSFRFGIGKSFKEFENYRFIFPFSDASCNVNPYPNAKERYANYLKTEDEDIQEVFEDSLDQLTYCPQDFRSPFRNDLYGGESNNPPNYKRETIRRYEPSLFSEPELLLETKTFDRDFYNNILRWLYRADMPDETIPLKEPVPTTFECASGPQCKSGNCDFDFYNRGMCQKDDDKWVNCQCTSGRECAGETVWTPQSTNVDTLDDAIERYNIGGELFYRIQRKVDFYYHNFEQGCGQFDDADDGVWYCQGTKCYEYNEPNNDNLVFDSIPGFAYPRGDAAWNEDHEFMDHHLKCSGSNGAMNTCIPVENDKTKFDLYRAANGEYVKPSSGSLYSIGCDGENCDLYRNILLGDSSKITDILNDWGDEHEVAVDAFPNKIFFFGEERSANPPDEDDDKWPIWDNAIGSGSYIGYTFLTPDQFKKTNFYDACELTDDSYDQVEFKAQYFYYYSDTFGVSHFDPGRLRMIGPGGSYFRRLDKLFEYAPTIPLIHPGYGFKPIQISTCSDWSADEYGKYWYARNILFLKDAGKCKLDDNYRPIVRGLGWCEGCSYLTLAQHQVKAQEEYDALIQERYRRPDAAPHNTTTICIPGFCSYDGEGYFSIFGTKPTLNADPETIFLLQKEEQYLREGILPVLDLTDSSNWNGALIVTEDSIVEEGPSILIVDKVNSQFDDSDVDRIKSRANAAKDVCGKCLVAFSIDNGASGSLGGKERMAKDKKVVRDMSADLKQMADVDIITIQLYPHEFAKENTQLCDDKSSFFTTIVDELSSFGRTGLVYGKKFTLVNKMFVDTDVLPSCWQGPEQDDLSDLNEDPIYRLFAGIILRQRTLTQNGVIGMIYSDTSGLTEPVGGAFPNPLAKTNSDLYCSLEKAARLLVADPAITIYKKLPLQPADSPNVACKECTGLDISLGVCDLRCENGRECDTSDIPAGQLNNYRCPPDVFPEGSIPCTGLEDRPGCPPGVTCVYLIDPDTGEPIVPPGVPNLECTVLYGDGSIDIQTYAVSSLDSKYPDVIASMPEYYKCNVQDDSGNYSYTKIDLSGQAIAPIIFAYKNSQNEDCGVPDYNALIPMQCGGAVFPIKNYRIQCKFKGGPPEPWPPPTTSGPQCYDTLDNDNDGLIDYPNDPGCSDQSDTLEFLPECIDDVDNDGDGLVDDDDPGCYGLGNREDTIKQCSDDIDNDQDSLVDYPADPGCTALGDSIEGSSQCSDDIDNDQDSLVDYPTDHGCSSLSDTSEYQPECSDGIDNDGDGKTDYIFSGGGDQNCQDPSENKESPDQCADGIDNDGDGFIDDPEDPNCYSILDDKELADQCSDTIDNDSDGGIDTTDAGCFYSYGLTEYADNCSDTIDNDGDGLIDSNDPACSTSSDGSEYADECSDDVDNDGDGLVDYYDPECGLPGRSETA